MTVELPRLTLWLYIAHKRPVEYLVDETLIKSQRLLYPKGRTFFAMCDTHVFRNFCWEEIRKRSCRFYKRRTLLQEIY